MKDEGGKTKEERRRKKDDKKYIPHPSSHVPRYIVFIVGPTATGKTDAAYLLARQLNCEVVSCDSMLVYKEASVIISKPSDKILKEVPHHFVDIISVKDSYSVFEYYKEASEKIRNLFSKGGSVIVCGGSGLYAKALLDGVFEGVGENKELRCQLERKAREYGSQYLYKELEKVDTETAAKISPNDLKRVIRALEVYTISGVPLSRKKKEACGIYNELPVKVFGLRLNRPQMYDRINKRVDRMVEAGAVSEVKELLKLDLSVTAGKIIGVKELSSFLKNESSLDEAMENMKRNTRRFAKRQVTWFGADKRIEWIDVDNMTSEQIKNIIINNVGAGL
ncbi:MAG: tRNA (adenosine(37)-N6)-dimethylallyltransferase MiaA [Candidatus Omnitrophica bacterium]|nr:tRNA (adenosine(37)-N6)-dimethylallyltransferase MiaA [Candidatus Omnitrophota bacterium]